MNKRKYTIRFLLSLLFLMGFSGTVGAVPGKTAWAGTYNLARWNIPSGDYSGITALGNGLYAVVNDKQNAFVLWRIRQDSLTGKVLQVEQVKRVVLQDCGDRPRLDLEAVSWWPEKNCLLLASEQEQVIRGYDLSGRPLHDSWTFDGEASPQQIHANYGFESLTADTVNACIWTCTENVLRTDGDPAGITRREPVLLPVYRLNTEGGYRLAGRYRMDQPQARRAGRTYCFGVSEVLSLPEYGLLILEREFFVSKNYLRSWVNHKIYRVDPQSLLEAEGGEVEKTLVVSFRTRLNPFSYRLANYEGMAAGIRLPDGRQTVLLLCDAQSGAGNRLFHLKDYLRVLVLPPVTE